MFNITDIKAADIGAGDVFVTAERDAILFDRVVGFKVKDGIVTAILDCVTVDRDGHKVMDGARIVTFGDEDEINVHRKPVTVVVTSKPKRKRASKAEANA